MLSAILTGSGSDVILHSYCSDARQSAGIVDLRVLGLGVFLVVAITKTEGICLRYRAWINRGQRLPFALLAGSGKRPCRVIGRWAVRVAYLLR